MLRSVEAKCTLAFSACWSPPELARGSFGVSRRTSSVRRATWRNGSCRVAATRRPRLRNISLLQHGASDLSMLLVLDEHDGTSNSSTPLHPDHGSGSDGGVREGGGSWTGGCRGAEPPAQGPRSGKIWGL